MTDPLLVTLAYPNGLMSPDIALEVGGVDLTKILSIASVKFETVGVSNDPVLTIICNNSLAVIGKARVQLEQTAFRDVRETELLEMEQREGTQL
jgi:hypothetical protein